MKSMRQIFAENGWQDDATLNQLGDCVREYLTQYYIGGEGFTEELNCCEIYLNERLFEIKTNV